MKFLILDSAYPAFQQWLYAQNERLADATYADQVEARRAENFMVGDHYCRALTGLGHEAEVVTVNNHWSQNAWAAEHGLPIRRRSRKLRFRRGFVPWFASDPVGDHRILTAQVQAFRPDVLFVLDLFRITRSVLESMRPFTGSIVGQHAATSLGSVDLDPYDLFLSSFPPTVDFLRTSGHPASYLRLGFAAEVLNSIQPSTESFDVVFVGSFLRLHSSRVRFLEAVCRTVPGFVAWGTGIENVGRSSPLRDRFMGAAWGMQMYQIFRDARIVLNHHGDVPAFANNLRLYEATGVGGFLLTDWKPDLDRSFAVNKEVVAYRDAEDCVELIERFLDDQTSRRRIAEQGQRRTLKEHTWDVRAQELLELLSQHRLPR